MTAEGSSGRIRSARKSGTFNVGRWRGSPPKRDPIVATGRSNSHTAAVPARRATIGPGTRRQTSGVTSTRASDAAVRPAVTGSVRGRTWPSADMRAKNSVGTLSSGRPSASLICVVAMSSAMPLVKPMTIGLGM